jgi:hypothetical protein
VPNHIPGEGVANRGALHWKRTEDLQPEVAVDKTKFLELIHEKVDAAASDPHQFRQKPVTAMLHQLGNLFRSQRFVGF